MHAACSSRTSASTRARSCRSSSGRSSGRIPRSAHRRGRARALLRCGRAPSRPTRKTVTVVVARIANAGELAGRLEPEVLRALFDRYGDRVRSAVDRHGGVARVESGRALAVFGVPVVREDDALRAVRAAAELRDGIGLLNDGLLPEHGVFLEVQTAIDTGDVLVTQAEGELATGRPVTAADELERSARPGQILLGEPAHALVRELVEVEAVSPGVHRLVGLLPDVHGRALRLDSPLIGRRRQLAALSSAFESVVTERALHLLTVLGAAGVGKSRLVREFVESVESVATLLHGQCLPYGGGDHVPAARRIPRRRERPGDRGDGAGRTRSTGGACGRAPARSRPGRPAVGRAAAARPRRGGRRDVEGRADPARLPRAPRAAGGARHLGREERRGELDRPRPVDGGRIGASRRQPSRRVRPPRHRPRSHRRHVRGEPALRRGAPRNAGRPRRPAAQGGPLDDHGGAGDPRPAVDSGARVGTCRPAARGGAGVLELASVEGRSFSSRAVAELSGDETARRPRGAPGRARAEGARAARRGRHGSLLLPAPAHPRRRLRVDPAPRTG